jgi:hypothetical protein
MKRYQEALNFLKLCANLRACADLFVSKENQQCCHNIMPEKQSLIVAKKQTY